jgi:hypothetical protein
VLHEGSSCATLEKYIMNTMHHHHSSRPGPLEIKQLAEFDATLGDLPESDKRQRRIIYLRDANQQIGLQKNVFKGFGCLLLPFAIIPLFWPFLIFFWFMKKKTNTLLSNQLNNALAYWKIQDHEINQNNF